MADLLLSLLGLARRAGKLKIGADPVCESTEKGKAKLIITASDISQNTYKEILKNAEKYYEMCIYAQKHTIFYSTIFCQIIYMDFV